MNTPRNYGLFTPGVGVPVGAIPLGTATAYRLFQVSSSPAGGDFGAGTPAAGGVVDGIGVPSPFGASAYFACNGVPVLVEGGGAFNAGDLLQTDSVGRVVLHSSGTVVMRALESCAGAGSVVQTVFAR